MGGYLLLRVAPLLAATGWAATAAAWVGALTALLLGAVAVAQRDLKQLLAASTSAQLGFVVLAAGVAAVAGGTAHLVGARRDQGAAVPRRRAPGSRRWAPSELAGLRGAARRWPLVGRDGRGRPALAGGGRRRWRCGPPRTTCSPPRSSGRRRSTWWGSRAPRCPRRTPGRRSCSSASGDATGARDAEQHWDREEPAPAASGGSSRRPWSSLAAGAAVLGVLALPPRLRRRARAARCRVRALAGPVELLAVRAARGRRAGGGGRGARPPRSRVGRRLARPGAGRAPRRWSARCWRSPSPLPASTTASSTGAVDAGASARRGAARRPTRAAALDDRRRLDAARRGDRTPGSAASAGGARRPQTGQLHQYYAQAVAVLAVAVLLLVVVR